MKAIWKWVIGIVVVLLVIAGLAAMAFFWRGGMGGISYRGMPLERGWNSGPMMRGDEFTWQHAPMMRAGRGFGLFGGFFLLRGLLRWVLFGALLYGAYWLGRRNARVVVEPRSTAVKTAAVEPPSAGPPSDVTPPSAS